MPARAIALEYSESLTKMSKINRVLPAKAGIQSNSIIQFFLSFILLLATSRTAQLQRLVGMMLKK